MNSLTSRILEDTLIYEKRTPKCGQHSGVLVNALTQLAHNLRQTLAGRRLLRHSDNLKEVCHEA